MANESLNLIAARQKMFRIVLSLAAIEMSGNRGLVSYSDMTDAARELIAIQDAWDAEQKRRHEMFNFMAFDTSGRSDG